MIELATLQAKLIPLLGAAFAVLMTAIKHHTMAAVTGTPQTGDKRTEPPQHVPGGQRSTDPPKGA